MNYDQFCWEYNSLFLQMMKYSAGQAGAGIFAEKMAVLADDHPKFLERLEKELEQRALLDERFKDRRPLADNPDADLMPYCNDNQP